MLASNHANLHMQKASVPLFRQQGCIGLGVVPLPRQTAVQKVWAQQEDTRRDRMLETSRQDMYE